MYRGKEILGGSTTGQGRVSTSNGIENFLLRDVLQWSLQNNIREDTNGVTQELGAVKDLNADMGQGTAFIALKQAKKHKAGFTLGLPGDPNKRLLRPS